MFATKKNFFIGHITLARIKFSIHFRGKNKKGVTYLFKDKVD